MEVATTPFKSLVTHPRYWQWSLAMQLVRMPSLMSPIALVMMGEYITGKVSAGGLMVTIYVLCITLFSVPASRLMDRISPFIGIPLSLCSGGLMLVVLTWMAACKAPMVGAYILVGLSGAFSAGAGGTMRRLLSEVVPENLMNSAIALDATIIEFAVVAAPLIVALAASGSPIYATLAMGIASIVAAGLVLALRRTDFRHVPIDDQAVSLTRNENAKRKGRLWANPRFVFWMLGSLAFGHAMGTAETGILPLVSHFHHSAGMAAVMLDILSAASVASGLAYAVFSHRWKASRFLQAVILLSTNTVGSFILAAAPSAIMVSVAMVILGTCAAPLNTLYSVGVEKEIPIERKAEGFSLMNVSHTLGYALGGMFLATLPLRGMLVTCGISGLMVLLLSPVLIRRPRRLANQF